MSFPRVSAGTPHESAPTNSASWINAVSEATEHYQNRQRIGTAVSQPEKSPPIKVRNNTGADLPRGGVVGLGDSLVDRADPRTLWMAGETYAAGQQFALAVDAIPDGKIGRVVTIGPAIARVNVTDFAHRFAAPEPGSATLASADSGSVTLQGAPGATGEQDILVVIGGGGVIPPILTGLLKSSTLATVTAGSRGQARTDGTIEIWPDKTFAALDSFDPTQSYQDRKYVRLLAEAHDPAETYEIGDLILDGMTIRQNQTAGTLNGDYNVADWTDIGAADAAREATVTTTVGPFDPAQWAERAGTTFNDVRGLAVTLPNDFADGRVPPQGAHVKWFNGAVIGYTCDPAEGWVDLV